MRRAGLWLGVAILLTGCAVGVGHVGGLLLAIALALGMAACIEDTATAEDAEVDALDGVWESCCVGGEISTCFCEGGAACNYGWYEDCGDGTCSDFECPREEDVGVDSGVWEPCCLDGVISSCFCEAGVECNYGWFQTCADGSCSPDQCDDLDLGVDAAADAAPDAAVDAGMGPEGSWDVCCTQDGVSTCFCEAGFECNYGWFDMCGDGTCAFPEECAVPDDPDGAWWPCCMEDEVGSCFCPNDMECGFSQFAICPDGTCSVEGC